MEVCDRILPHLESGWHVSPFAFVSFLSLFIKQSRFLWAKLQVSILFKDYPNDGVSSALDSLPQTLELTYERILKDLDASNPPRKHETTKKKFFDGL